MKIKNPRHRYFTFFAFLNTLVDYMELNILPGIEYKQEMKMLGNQLMDRIIKLTSKMAGHLAPGGQRPGESDAEMRARHKDENLSIEQYVQAAHIMNHLFQIGLMIEEIENETKKQTLITQLNILLHSYDLPQLELIVTYGERAEIIESND